MFVALNPFFFYLQRLQPAEYGRFILASSVSVIAIALRLPGTGDDARNIIDAGH